MRGRGHRELRGQQGREEMAAGFQAAEVAREGGIRCGMWGDTPLRVGFVIPIPGMTNHSALPNDGIRTGYPHPFKHQPVKIKYIKHPLQVTDEGCSATPSTKDHCFSDFCFFFF